ncbi:MAG TPA: 2-oxoglutarate dehydrogenase E1 component, partial [Syntrophobacteraceae bacterium]|nr:2-oxoglutarate dehydrogenase E1 component [Syntrophobacteraceae bacterium]
MDGVSELNAAYVDAQYQRWKEDPHLVSRDWQWFFSGFEWGASPESVALEVLDRQAMLRQLRASDLIYRYRDLGHLLACLDPLASCPSSHPLLDLAAFRLSEEDLDRVFYTDLPLADTGHRSAGAVHHNSDSSSTSHEASAEAPGEAVLQPGQATLRDILTLLKETYCHSVGVEYMHLQDPGERRWLQERMEPTRNRTVLALSERLRTLRKLMEASLFEQFLHSKYVGQKRFSLEGAESVIALLDVLAGSTAAQGCQEIILGMAHRGRLNVQVNLLGKPLEEVFCDFEDSYDPSSLVGAGDVKYHKGYLGKVLTPAGPELQILLCDNPSHLESVNPVVEGVARGRQEVLGDDGYLRVLPVLIHGDSAFAGQGVVAETLNLSQLEGYGTGGTIHIVINNQIG